MTNLLCCVVLMAAMCSTCCYAQDSIYVPQGPHTVMAGHHHVTFTVVRTQYRSVSSTKPCGAFGWGRCPSTRVITFPITVTDARAVPRYTCASYARKDGDSCRVDCIVGQWKQEVECSNSCFEVVRRSRKIIRPADNGGNACPVTSDLLQCSSNPGCPHAGGCYRNGSVPSNTCQMCKVDTYSYEWQPRSGVACDDGQQCTMNDMCLSGVCQGTPYTCDRRGEDVCMASNTCDGSGGCVPTFHDSYTLCYKKADACDHDDTFCTGTGASCPVASLKPITDTPISGGRISFLNWRSNALATPYAGSYLSEEEEVEESNSTGIVVVLEGFTVPCGTISYELVVQDSDGQHIHTTDVVGASDETVVKYISATLSHSNSYRLVVTASNIRGSTIVQDAIPRHLCSEEG